MFWPRATLWIFAIWSSLFHNIHRASCADTTRTTLGDNYESKVSMVPAQTSTTVQTPAISEQRGNLLNLLKVAAEAEALAHDPSYVNYLIQPVDEETLRSYEEALRELASPVTYDHPDHDKRGHNLMRFGKRADDVYGERSDVIYGRRRDYDELLKALEEYAKRSSHNLMHFGKREYYDDDKRSGHNLMRFGRGNHNLMHFGKREYERDNRGHKIMNFGKRDENYDNDFEAGDKRGHRIMNFGKRGQDTDEDKRAGHRIMSFGKRDTDEEDKRAGHKIMSFGKREDMDEDKRAGHKIMSFGKREDMDEDKRAGHKIMSFGKREDMDEDKRAGHKIMSFGKREDMDEDKRAGHKIMSFGKREDMDEDKRAGHRIMSFGKREDMDEDKRAGHKIMSFGKREDMDEDKRAGHKIMSFGKREDMDEDKRAGHKIMSFGKREDTDMDEDKRAGHKIMSFGKREDMDEDKRAGHKIMSFGKRDYIDEDKRAGHKIMSFGKREDMDEDKRAGHKIMSFGKRDDGEEDKRAGHKIMSFGKREDMDEDKRAGHKIMSFGKREEYDEDKRGHRIMNFGKRDEDPIDIDEALRDLKRAGTHNVMHFGKREDGGDYDAYLPDDSAGRRVYGNTERQGHDVEELKDTLNGKDYVRYSNDDGMDYKRAGHNLMRFGKRGYDDSQGSGSSYENDKRGHGIVHFGKREVRNEDGPATKRKFTHFGKSGDNASSNGTAVAKSRKTRSINPFMGTLSMNHSPTIRAILAQLNRGPREDAKRGHNIMRFGKRGSDSNKIMHFGKRAGSSDRNHNIMRFGKRSPEVSEEVGFGDYSGDFMDGFIPNDVAVPDFDLNEDNYDDNQYFLDNLEREVEKRASHGIMHFGKRDSTELSPLYADEPFDEEDLSPMDYLSEKRGGGSNKIMHFGKRFGNEDDAYLADSEPNALRHSFAPFGKRSNDIPNETEQPNDNSYAQLKRYHSLMHFGKRRADQDGSDLGQTASYNVNRKRPEHNHNIMRFGRSIPDEEINATNQATRRKRYANLPDYLLGWKGSLFAPGSSKFEK